MPKSSDHTDGTLTMPDGRSVGFAEFGAPDGHPVLWCHGGPGSRLEPALFGEAARSSGLRLVAIDRPGYGLSSPDPGRTIAGWVPDGLAVADRLGLERFVVVGCSTGGAYALALASTHPGRVLAVVACCALTDMRWPEGRAMMTGPDAVGGAIARIWDAPDRSSAIAAAEEVFGPDGSALASMAGEGAPLPPADVALLSEPASAEAFVGGLRESFRHGVQGFVDDRIADGQGWATFDASDVRCPVVVLHGDRDTIVPVAQAAHTATLLPEGTQLKILPEFGHLSIATQVVKTVEDLLGLPSTGSSGHRLG